MSLSLWASLRSRATMNISVVRLSPNGKRLSWLFICAVFHLSRFSGIFGSRAVSPLVGLPAFSWVTSSRYWFRVDIDRSYEVERKLDRVLWEYIEAFEKEIGCPPLIMTMLWQMMQSKDTKNLILDKHFQDIMSKVKKIGWNDQDNRILETGRRCR